MPSALDHASKSSQYELPADLPCGTVQNKTKTKHFCDKDELFRERRNDWIQIGSAHSLGLSHIDAYGEPAWGETTGSGSGSLFCCIED